MTEPIGVVMRAHKVCKLEETTCHQPNLPSGERQASRGTLSHCLISLQTSSPGTHRAGAKKMVVILCFGR